MVFGASYSVLAIFLKFSIRLLYKVLLEEEGAKAQLPTVEKLATNYPACSCKNIVCDGWFKAANPKVWG
jgi:hypothetical protein